MEMNRMIDTDKFTFDLSKLRLLETEMQVTIWKHEKSGTPQIIIDEFKDALNHITKAIDILERDDL